MKDSRNGEKSTLKHNERVHSHILHPYFVSSKVIKMKISKKIHIKNLRWYVQLVCVLARELKIKTFPAEKLMLNPATMCLCCFFMHENNSFYNHLMQPRGVRWDGVGCTLQSTHKRATCMRVNGAEERIVQWEQTDTQAAVEIWERN